jgi:hypothetical protein
MSDCKKFPIILDPNHEFTNHGCPNPAGIKTLDKVFRTLPVRVINTACEPVLQDEAGFAILDEVTGSFIHDDLKGDQNCG